MNNSTQTHRYILFNLFLILALLASTGIALADGNKLFIPVVGRNSTTGYKPSSLTPDPSSVNTPGSFQSEVGCSGDWQPDCPKTYLGYDADDDVWQGTQNIPAGSWEYKAALNGGWDENYGQNAQQNGANIPLNLTAVTSVKFYYDHKTHWITDNSNSVIATAPGSYQSEIGCPGDWQPDCLRSWLQDPDGNGVFEFSTEDIPLGDYKVKVTHGESWDINYGAGGVQNGADIPFNVPVNGSLVKFSYVLSSHILTVTVISPGHNQDNNVEYFGLGHNSQDLLYRAPFGAVTPETQITLRFRTYHNDVTSVKARVWDTTANAQIFLNMQPVATDVSCYDPNQPAETCDFWQAKYTPANPTLLYYRFIIQDGSATAYYDDDYFQDGGWGEATPQVQDDSYVITVYDPDFTLIPWMQNAVVYQIFPDRFRDGRSDNTPSIEEPRYGYPDEELDQIILKQWGELPEGYCRHYQNPAELCTEGPRGRDYFGGDLRGIQQRLNYLKALGINTIYLNPIFEAASNHAYDTQDYYQIDHFFGTSKDWDELIRQANRHGIRIVLDGVFNHVSSDSAYFDRYGHFGTVGACEDVNSPYRNWFYFQEMPGGPCAGPNGPNSSTYSSWFGFDSLPVLNKSEPAVQDLFYGGENSVGSYWLKRGAAGWRLDVMGDSSFPADFWPEFRQQVKETKAEAVIIGELWKKHEALAKFLGDQADTTMNYRFRNAILGFFGQIDDKGFPDDGQANQPPSLFARKLLSVREDYPDAAYFALLNLMDSHDTQRILWSLTPGERNREDREFNTENLALGKQKLKLATVVQTTTPGAPTIFYGDEVGLTGDDDPDDRRTFPWNQPGQYGSGGDQALLMNYQKLIAIRQANSIFRNGKLSFLQTNDAERSLAYLLRNTSSAAIVAINRDEVETRTFTLDVTGKLPSAVVLTDIYDGLGMMTAIDGVLTFNLPPLGAAILLPVGSQDLVPPAAPVLSLANEGSEQIEIAWSDVSDAASYNIYRSPVSSGGYVLVGQTIGTSYSDSGLDNGKLVYYVVRAVDSAGNEGLVSNEINALPHFNIGWANLQWPPSMVHTISVSDRTDTAYGQVWIDGATSQPGATPTLWAQLGFGPDGSNPAGNPAWTWVDASFNVDAGNNDEFMASMLPEALGTFDYAFRYSTTAGRDWLYADLDGTGTGYSPAQAGNLTVNSSGDTTAPLAPTNLMIVTTSPQHIELNWDDVPGDSSLYGYEVLRATSSGGTYTMLARLTDSMYIDTAVDESATYFYVVLAVDYSFNRSGYSNEVEATAAPRSVAVTFNVEVPISTPAGWTVYIAGTLDRLDGGLPAWDPGGVELTQVDATHWTINLSGRESTEIEYKYTLGSWDYVEKGASCDELDNRVLTLSYGMDGTQTVNDTVLNWRNISPCGP